MVEITVAAIAALGGILATAVGVINRRRNREEHGDVISVITQGFEDHGHAIDRVSHRLSDLNDAFTRHLEHHIEIEG